MILPNGFVHLHVHSDYSLLDGASKTGDIVARAADVGMSAIALTDHGNLHGAIEFSQAAKKRGIKPLVGCEVYFTEGSQMSRDPVKDRRSNHLGLIAKSLEGYHNLVKIVSDANTKGFYYKPRTDWAALEQHSKGLVALSGCMSGVIPRLLLNGEEEAARKAADRFISTFGKENFFIEIQDHGLPEQALVNPLLVKLAREFGLRLVCTNDSHYTQKSDAAAHDALLCLQTGAKLTDTERMRFPSDEFYIKTGSEMQNLFRELPESVTNTSLVAEMCNLDIAFPKGAERYPSFPVPIELGLSSSDYLESLCTEGLKARFDLDYEEVSKGPAVSDRIRGLQELSEGKKPTPPDYSGLSEQEEIALRLQYELAVIRATGFLDYFLVVQDFVGWAKNNDIPVGPGRGSGAGSLVAYALGITDIDPIRFKLLFERFLNPDRVSPPDLDIDLCSRRRPEVIEYVTQKYGPNCVAGISTFGTFRAKGSIRDLARVHSLPYGEADAFAKRIPDTAGSVDDALALSSELTAVVAANPVYRTIISQARQLDGMVRSVGTHASGVVIAGRPLSDFVPLVALKDTMAVQFDGDAVSKVGLLKMDMLGIKTLTVIKDTEDHVRRAGRPKFNVANQGLDDPKTFDLIKSGNTVGVFQIESAGMREICMQVGTSNINELNAVIALYRPGPLQFIPDYVRGKKDPSSIRYPHPILEPILKETHGVMVYQEQVMESAQVLAGYTLGQADLLRRAMGKKDSEAMANERERFVEGAERTNAIPEKQAHQLFDVLENFASYGFNKSHSAAYAILSYRTAFLKANHPEAYMAALLTSKIGDSNGISHLIDECASMGIPLAGPDVNESLEAFTPGTNAIRFGLAGIKGVGSTVAEQILVEREKGGSFQDYSDFLNRCGAATGKRTIEALAKAGGFDSLDRGRKDIVEHIDSDLKQAQNSGSSQASFFSVFEDEAGARVKPVEYSKGQLLSFEKELLGVYLSGHPLDRLSSVREEFDSHSLSELPELPDRTPFRLVCIVEQIKKKTSKKDNAPWVEITVSDGDTTAELLMFPKAYAKNGDKVVENAAMVFTGQIWDADGSTKLTIQDAVDAEQFLPPAPLPKTEPTASFLVPADLRTELARAHASALPKETPFVLR